MRPGPGLPRTASDDDRPWRGFARAFAATLAGLLAGYLALAYAVDPYDSGRSTLFAAQGVRPQGPRTAAASRGRDPAYRGVILGNSHIQLVEPARLTEATGIAFVQLSVPGTAAGEQLTLLDWVLRHHRALDAVVLAADEYWCGDDPALPAARPFPFWLFAEDTATYLRGLLRLSVAEEVAGRIGWLAGSRRRARPDGWWDYEAEYLKAPAELAAPARLAAREAPAPDLPEPGRGGPYPAAARLSASVARLPETTALILVFPPVYRPALPRPGTPREAADRACKAQLVAAARTHRASAVVDWRVDRAENRDPDQFFDQRHYRHPLARALGAEIAAAIRGLVRRQ